MIRRLALLGLLLAPAPVAAQVGAGVTAGTVHLPSGATQKDLNGIVQVSPTPWLTLGATVTHVHVSQTAGSVTASSDGVGDLPLSAAVEKALPGRMAPVLGAALDLTVPTGDAAAGLGTGSTTVGMDLGVEVTPRAGTRLALGASRELSGNAGTSALSPSRATSLAVEGGFTFAPRWTAALSLSADVGSADSGQALDRSFGIGVTHLLRGPLALTVDAGRGLTSTAPQWELSIGIGTVFGGNNPVGGQLTSKRLAHALSAGVNRGQGKGKTGHH